MQVYNDEYLTHFGIKGMKWGYKKYDGHVLSDKEKKGIGKEYTSHMKKATNNIKKQGTNIYIKSYNNAAKDMNNGGIDKFNSQQEKKYGTKFANRKGYMEDYEKLFNTTLSKHRDSLLSDLYKNDKNFKKGQELVDKYKMLDWNQLARDNAKFIK